MRTIGLSAAVVAHVGVLAADQTKAVCPFHEKACTLGILDACQAAKQRLK